jgi:hypothetical protein
MRPVHWFRFKLRFPRRFSTGLDTLPAKASTHPQSFDNRPQNAVLIPSSPRDRLSITATLMKNGEAPLPYDG